MDVNHTAPTPRRSPNGFKRTWTVVDTVIVILLLVAIGATFFRWAYDIVGKQEADEMIGNYYVIFQIDETHGSIVEGLEGGDALYLAEDGTFLGRLCHDSLTTVQVTDADHPGYVMGKAAMLCDGSMKENSLHVVGLNRYLTPGDQICVRTEREVFVLCVTEIANAIG